MHTTDQSPLFNRVTQCIAFVILLLGVPNATHAETSLLPARAELDLDFDWQFQLFEIYNNAGDSPDSETYNPGPSLQEVLDSEAGDWQAVNVPHDWAIEGDYDPTHPTRDNSGYVQAGIGWYRKTIDVSPAWQGKRVRLEFDGVFRNSTVWVNGIEQGYRPYGWISFGYDITDAIDGKEKAEIVVRVENSQQNAARWYTGSGIYAPVRLVITDPVHIAPDGTFVRTEMNDDGSATIHIETEVLNDSSQLTGMTLVTSVVDSEGKEVAHDSAPPMTIGAKKTGQFTQYLNIVGPKLWSCETPHLYTAVTEIRQGDKLLDRYETHFGIRTIEWKTDTGFWLNGENVKLKGVCNHQDAGPLGAAVPDKVLRMRLQQLKDMGCNAFRTAHNPQTPVFYDICDEMGMLVMDEIFDGWKRKAPADYGAYDFEKWWRRDVEDWIRRDRNHPSIIIWSVGNETGRTDVPMGKWIVEHCHQLDPTRPVTSGSSDAKAMDVHGENGRSESEGFPERHEASMDKPFVATEYPHTWQTRGFYKTQTWYRDGFPNPKQRPYEIPNLTPEEIFFLDWTEPANKTNLKKQIFNPSYDNGMVRISARRAWQQVRDIPWWSGQFRWTGHDYLGEGGYVHGGWPFKAFMGGAIDLCNFKKDLYYLYQSQWTDEPMVHILPHWTHPTMTPGTEIPVWVYSNCDEVELLLNGESLGRISPGANWDEMQCQWLVPWTPGELKAVAYNDGQVVAESQHTTAGAPARIALSSDTEELKPDGRDIAQVTVATQDADGVFYPFGENRIYFHLDGPARIRALGNGSPLDVEPHCGVNSRVAFFGLAKAFIESTREPGDIVLIAASICGEKQQLTSNMVSIDVRCIGLRGEHRPAWIRVYYTIDGTPPTKESSHYTGPFSIEAGTTVRAIVLFDGRQILELQDRFGEGEGFYWGDGSDDKDSVAIETGGNQAEDAHLAGGAQKLTTGRGFHGTGYVDFNNHEGAITWYIENDGNPADFHLTFRYAGNDPDGGRPMQLTINGKTVIDRVMLKNSGDWSKQWTEWSTVQRLGQGANEIRLFTTGQGGMCIDQLHVTEEE